MSTNRAKIYPPSTLQRLRRTTRSWPPSWFEKFLESWKGNPGYMGCGLDHGRSFKNIAVFAPYAVDGSELCELLLACQQRDLEVFITGKTYYYPGATFTICIYREEDADEMAEFVSGIDTKIEVPTEHTGG